MAFSPGERESNVKIVFVFALQEDLGLDRLKTGLSSVTIFTLTRVTRSNKLNSVLTRSSDLSLNVLKKLKIQNNNININFTCLVENDVFLGDLQLSVPHHLLLVVDAVDREHVSMDVVDVRLAGDTTHLGGG